MTCFWILVDLRVYLDRPINTMTLATGIETAIATDAPGTRGNHVKADVHSVPTTGKDAITLDGVASDTADSDVKSKIQCEPLLQQDRHRGGRGC